MAATPERSIFWTVFAVAAVAMAFSGAIDQIGRENAQTAFKRALVTFAVSRALDGAISVAQGTELAFEPAGVGVVLSLGQVLDPINDLVERFSTVMLVAASSLGLQNLLLDITSSVGFDAGLLIAALLVLVTAWVPVAALRDWAPPARRLLLMIFFLRFAVPLLVIGSELMFDVYLDAEQAEAVSALENVQVRIEAINESAAIEPATEQNPSLFDQFGAMLDRTLESMDVSNRLDRLQAQVSEASEHVVNLIVIFVLQTVVLPVAFLWLFVELLKGIALRMAGRGNL